LTACFLPLLLLLLLLPAAVTGCCHSEQAAQQKGQQLSESELVLLEMNDLELANPGFFARIRQMAVLATLPDRLSELEVVCRVSDCAAHVTPECNVRSAILSSTNLFLCNKHCCSIEWCVPFSETSLGSAARTTVVEGTASAADLMLLHCIKPCTLLLMVVVIHSLLRVLHHLDGWLQAYTTFKEQLLGSKPLQALPGHCPGVCLLCRTRAMPRLAGSRVLSLPGLLNLLAYRATVDGCNTNLMQASLWSLCFSLVSLCRWLAPQHQP